MQSYQLIRSRRRTIALEISREGCLIVRAPLRVSQSYLDDVIQRRQAWISQHLNKIIQRQRLLPAKQFVSGESFLYLGQTYPLRLIQYPVGNKNFCSLQFTNNEFLLAESVRASARGIWQRWYKTQAQKIISQRVGDFAKQFGFQYAKVKITQAKKRWGSCSPKGNLNFSWRLVMAPPNVIDYVVVHELAHLKIKNHQRAFWQSVEQILPDYRSRRAWLKQNEHLLNGF